MRQTRVAAGGWAGGVQAALDHSLPIKKVEAGLRTLVLWGRITVLNGKVCWRGVVPHHLSCPCLQPEGVHCLWQRLWPLHYAIHEARQGTPTPAPRFVLVDPGPP